MSKTIVDASQVSKINSDSIDTTTTGKALSTKIVAGSNITINSTGVDVGTGEVTINSTGGGSWGTISGTLANQTDLNSVLANIINQVATPSIETGTVAPTPVVGKLWIDKNTSLGVSHSPVTVLDTPSIDLTLLGQSIQADVKFGSTVGTVCQGNDSRVVNSDAHAAIIHGNPHVVTAYEVGAEAYGTMTTHTALYDHTLISQLWTKATTPKVRHVFWPAGAAIPVTLNATTPQVNTLTLTTNKVTIDTYGFDATTQEAVEFVGCLEHWNALAIKIKFAWTFVSSVASTGVEWSAQARALADVGNMDLAFGIPQVAVDTAVTMNYNHITDKTLDIAVAGAPVNGQRLQIRVLRDPSSLNDTMEIDALLIGIWIEYTEAATEEVVW